MSLRRIPGLLMFVAALVVGCNSGGPQQPPPPDPPEILSVFPTGNVGVSGSRAHFSTETVGEVIEWMWDFGGAGTESTSSEAQPILQLSNPGTHSGSVTACNGDGCSEPFTFVIEVHGTAGHWDTYTLDGGHGVLQGAALLADGRPVLVAVDGVSNELEWLTADRKAPSAAEHWTTSTVAPLEGSGFPQIFLQNSGTPLVTTRERFYQATVASPTGPGDWNSFEAFVPYNEDLAYFDGALVAAIPTPTDDQLLYDYQLLTTAAMPPRAASDWHSLGSLDDLGLTDLSVSEERLIFTVETATGIGVFSAPAPLPPLVDWTASAIEIEGSPIDSAYLQGRLQCAFDLFGSSTNQLHLVQAQCPEPVPHDRWRLITRRRSPGQMFGSQFVVAGGTLLLTSGLTVTGDWYQSASLVASPASYDDIESVLVSITSFPPSPQIPGGSTYQERFPLLPLGSTEFPAMAAANKYDPALGKWSVLLGLYTASN